MRLRECESSLAATFQSCERAPSAELFALRNSTGTPGPLPVAAARPLARDTELRGEPFGDPCDPCEGEASREATLSVAVPCES